MKTLLATDGSSYATTALATASQLLTRTDNRFDLMCVVPEFRQTPTRTKQFLEKYCSYMQRNAGVVLSGAREVLQSEGIDPRVLGKNGSPGDVLVAFAEDYDVIVVGAQSRGEKPSPGLGPVASRIVEKVSGITLVGRRLINDKNFKILVGVDGSTMSRNAIEALMTHFNLSGAQITLMHVVEKPWLRLHLEEDQVEELERAYAESPEEPEAEKLFANELRSEGEQIIEEAREQLAGQALFVEARLEEGIPASELLLEAEVGDYDLAIVGASGGSDLKHTMLGSVAFKLAYHAPCSVAIVR